ncbi:hypothetical protein H0H87_006147 [Tephrocybe sp. NHM501043]|nr:hypothetical protein H0H87_006147 [Tephrocybe sp. NHM501043]
MPGSLVRVPGFTTLQVHGGERAGGNIPRSYPAVNPKLTMNGFLTKSSLTSSPSLTSNIVHVFEDRMAILEGGVAAIATASGQAAQLVAILALARSGDNIIAS